MEWNAFAPFGFVVVLISILLSGFELHLKKIKPFSHKNT